MAKGEPVAEQTQMYELRITATGEVRDKDGNLLRSEPIESVQTITEAEALAILESQESS